MRLFAVGLENLNPAAAWHWPGIRLRVSYVLFRNERRTVVGETSGTPHDSAGKSSLAPGTKPGDMQSNWLQLEYRLAILLRE